MDVSLGVVVVALELVPTSKRMFGNNTLQGHTGKLRHVSPSNYVPIWDAVVRAKPGVLPEEYGPRLRVRRTLDQESQHGAWAHGLAGLGPYPVQRVRACTIRPGSKAQ